MARLGGLGITTRQHVVSLLARPVVSGDELWSWSVWRPIEALLTQWIPGDAVETVSHQIRRDTRRAVPFSKLAWGPSGSERWTHGSPMTATSSANWIFGSTHAFFPPWSTCVRTNRSPSVYVELKARPIGNTAAELLLVSLDRDGSEEVPDALRSLLCGLARARGGLAAYAVRPFARAKGPSLVRGVDEITHSEIDRNLTMEALQEGSREMDRRTRVESGRWAPLSPTM